MSLALFGLILVIILWALARKNSGAAAGALVGLMLGMVLAGSDGPLSSAAKGFVSGARTALDTLGTSLFGGA
jgi:hypothetical protein